MKTIVEVFTDYNQLPTVEQDYGRLRTSSIVHLSPWVHNGWLFESETFKAIADRYLRLKDACRIPTLITFVSIHDKYGGVTGNDPGGRSIRQAAFRPQLNAPPLIRTKFP